MTTANDNDLARDVAETVASLFAVPVVVEAAAPVADLGALFPDERTYVERAVPKRQVEFATARRCARRALSRLGIEPCSLVPHADRSPSWPKGVVGSITHTDGLCVVVVADERNLAGIGLDVESAAPLPRDLEALVCTVNERRWLDRLEADERGTWAKLLFSAKEAFYKCQYSTTHRFLEFQDVEVELDAGECAFSARVPNENGDKLDSLPPAQGRWAWRHGLVITSSLLMPAP